jgi:MATE family multidrug resistance protein
MPLMVFAASMPVFMISVSATAWLEGLGRPMAPLIFMWAANAVNLGVDLLLVPGTFGLPAMGAVGAAIGTLGARGLIGVCTLVWIARMKDARELGVFDRPAPDPIRAREQRRIGYGAGGSQFFEILAFSAMNVIAGWISELAVAAWAVVLNVAALVFMVPLGLGTATAVLVGKAYGAGDEPGVDRAALIGYVLAAAFGLAAGLAVWAFATPIAHVYTADPTTIGMAVGCLFLSCFFYLPDALQVVVAQSLRARGDAIVPTITHMMSYFLIMLPLAVVLAITLKMGLAGILWAVIAASFVAAGLLLGRFWMLARRGATRAAA